MTSVIENDGQRRRGWQPTTSEGLLFTFNVQTWNTRYTKRITFYRDEATLSNTKYTSHVKNNDTEDGIQNIYKPIIRKKMVVIVGYVFRCVLNVNLFHWLNPPGRIMALGLIQPVTEMSARDIPWGGKAAGA